MLDMQKKEAMAGGERITVDGSVRYRGKEVMSVSPSRRAKMGIVLCPERRRIFKESTVLENLKIGGYLATPAQAKETLAYVFKVFPALYKLKNRIGGFSQRRGAADAGHRACPDGPTKNSAPGRAPAGAQPADAGDAHAHHPEIRDERKISIIVTEQYARPVFPIVDYAFILENGSAVLEGTREDLMDNPDVRSAYFGV
jgi:branched-chain amino acid transport system ATP-binding protein